MAKDSAGRMVGVRLRELYPYDSQCDGRGRILGARPRLDI
jgi:hypothetical protein